MGIIVIINNNNNKNKMQSKPEVTFIYSEKVWLTLGLAMIYLCNFIPNTVKPQYNEPTV
jgi:hypothetical protein